MTAFQVVETHGVTVGVEMRGAHPQTEYLFGWLRDHLVRDIRCQRAAGETAGTLAALVREQWPGRAFFVDVPRKDRLGRVRIEDDGQPVSSLTPH